VAIVLAIHNPDLGHLRAQIASLIAQTHANWVCVIVSDGDARDTFRAVSSEVAGDMRFVFYNRPQWSGVLTTFAEGLRAAPDDAAFFAFCDQDDVWHADKLAAQIGEITERGAALVHCDARIVGPAGELVAGSMVAAERRPRGAGPFDLALRNIVTGMSALFTAAVREAALPFPCFPGYRRDPFLHDTWIALVASLLGEVRQMPTALVDYRQHGGNFVGLAKRPRPRSAGLTGAAIAGLPGIVWDAARRQVGAYRLFRLQMRYLAARRDELRMRGVALGPLRGPVGRDEPDRGLQLDLALAGKALTGLLGPERGRVKPACAALLGRQALRLRARVRSLANARASRTLRRRLRWRRESGASGRIDWQRYIDRRMVGLAVEVDATRAAGVVLLVPSLNAQQIFAGIATALDFGLLLAMRGLEVRVVATDQPVSDPGHGRLIEILRSRLASFTRASVSGSVGDPLARMSFADGMVDPIRIGERDAVVATAWWTCYKARDLIAIRGRREAFYYLIQDYEPHFYAWSADYAQAMRTYSMDMIPIFNSTYLARFFKTQHPDLLGGEHHVFRPAVLGEEFQADLSDRPRENRKRVMLYGRPSVARNLFGMAVWALGRWIEAARLGPEDIEVVSLGEDHPDVSLPNGVRMVARGKLPWAEYKRFVQGVDIGLALMLSPHPSHLPLEMAAAGAVVVTNTFEGKDLGEVSGNIVSVEAGVDEVTAGLARAYEKAHDLQARAQGARFDLDLGRPLQEVADAVADRLKRAG
jgi:CTP:molybdopterin cytidylyltransferase MocA